MRRGVQGDQKEQSEVRALRVRCTWAEVVGAVEEVKEEKWEAFRDRYGDWGRDMALWVGRRECGLKLGDLGRLGGGLDYRTAGSGVAKAMKCLESDREFMRNYKVVRKRLGLE